jgi:ribosome recycling factor
MDRYRNYLKDNVTLFKEKIEELKLNKANDEFAKGQLLAYYDVLTIFKEQAEVFDIDLKEIGLDTYDENNILY